MAKDIYQQLDALDHVSKRLPRMIGAIALNFTLDRFRAQNWIGNTTEPWPKRKARTRWGTTRRNKGRALLINTGRGRRSIRLAEATQERVVISSDVEYMKAHNEGFRGKVTQQVKSHSRTRKAGRKRITYTVKAHSRTIQQNIPQRRFLGLSPYLITRIEREVTAEIMKALK